MRTFFKNKLTPIYFFLFLALISLVSCKDLRNKVSSQIKYQSASKAHGEGDFKKAIKLYKELIIEDPKNELFVYDLGMAYLDSKDFASAKMQVQKLNDMDRDDLAEQLAAFMGKAKELNDQ